MRVLNIDPRELEKTHGKARSPHWAAFRRQHLAGKVCAACGGSEKLELHHIVPFHECPEKELDPNNVIALCEGNKHMNCHLEIGHGGNFRGINPKSPELARAMLEARAASKESVEKPKAA